MNFGKAFSYVFDDPNWLGKIIIPVLYGLIPIIGWAVLLGYILRTTKNVAAGMEYPLQNCEFGADLASGFKYFLVTLIYGLPSMILIGLLGILSVAFERTENWLAIFGIVIVGALFFAYIIFLNVVLPVVQAQMAVKGTIASGFDFKHIFGMLTKNIGSWLLVIVGIFIGSLIAPMGGILFAVGALLTNMYSQLMIAHLAGQAYVHSQPEV